MQILYIIIFILIIILIYYIFNTSESFINTSKSFININKYDKINNLNKIPPIKTFIPSNTFKGYKSNMIFKRGAQGNGYYIDRNKI